MQYVQLRRKSDWGTEYYVTPSGERCKFRGFASVRFKDGAEATLPLGIHGWDASYMDHGKTYEARGEIECVSVMVHGCKKTFLLDELEVSADDFAIGETK